MKVSPHKPYLYTNLFTSIHNLTPYAFRSEPPRHTNYSSEHDLKNHICTVDITQGSPKPHITASMGPAATAKAVHSRPSLTTLPRETRNEIYGYLVISSKPIKLCFDHDSSWLYLRTSNRHNNDISVEFLCHAVEDSELAQEVYEEFFRNNTFDCGSSWSLQRFLTTTTTRFNFPTTSRINFEKNLLHDEMSHGYVKFEKKPWIRKVKISIFTGDFEYKPSEKLAHLSRCPHLQQVDITIFRVTSQHGNPDPVDRTIEAIARVCKSIRAKVGVGLIVKVQKDWGRPTSARVMINNSKIEDVSWMWEEPGEEARERAKKGFGAHREKIQVLMSAGWAGQEGKVGAWAEHWNQVHIEQQRLKES